MRTFRVWLCALPVLAVAAAFAQHSIGSSASIKLDSGPHKGTYDFAPTEACVIAAFDKKPLGLSVVMASQNASFSLDMPNLDEKHAKELQIVLVVADVKAGAARKSTTSVTYEIDTRPDTVLEPFQKAERANKGMTGKVTTTLMQQAASAMLTFSGETQSGVRMSGEITCRKVAAE
jgi:hypothetical protein